MNFWSFDKSVFIKGLGILSLALLLFVLYLGLSQAPAWESSRVGDKINLTGIEESGSLNLVTAVLWDFRGYDTMGEAVVLFTAVLGIGAVLKGGKANDKQKNG